MSSLPQRRLAIVLAVLLVVSGAIGLRAMLRPEPVRFSAMFESTVGLYPGSDVQVLGVPVGRVTKVQPAGESVRVSMELDPGREVAADTAAVIIAPTLVSDRFVQLTAPWAEGEGIAKLRSGTVLDLDRTAVPVEIDDLYEGLTSVSDALGPDGANRDGALSDLLDVAAANLDGQGEGLNTMFREFGEASATLSGLDDDFFATIRNFEKLNAMLLANDSAVSRVNEQFADVAGFLADDREDMGRAAKNLGEAMAILDDFIRDNRAHLKKSVDNLVPTTKTLRKQRDSLEEMVRLAPLLMQNLLRLYDPDNNVLVGRGNLNEATVWSDTLTARTSEKAPPTLLEGAVRSGR
ncbi:MCE family protein [Nocardioides humi]|uniref:MCE family protein n=1 Tax=Nocardioides humi TaxID=449461 RepID=A0ABN2AWH5_9ACTN|nr:MCE family protein [Nocardioides humi]